MIKSVELANWKAFDSWKTDFLDGVNFLIGANAAGKTSILEAICLAITGEALTVDDPKKLVKGGKEAPARITVEFLHNLKNYRVERSLSEKRRMGSRLYCDRELLTESWDDVSQFMKDLLGVDKRFFERVLYMSEGDVFRFIAYPPKEGITAQIEDALGIDRMESLLSEVEKQEEYYQGKEEENKAKKKWLENFLPKQRFGLETLRARKSESENMLKSLRAKSDDLAERFFTCRQEMEQLETAILKIDQIEKELQNLVNVSHFSKAFLQEIMRVQSHFRKKLQEVTDEIHPKLGEKGALEERVESISKVLDLISSVKTDKEDVQCPVCGKSLSIGEIKELRNRFDAQKQAIDGALLTLHRKLEELEAARQQLEEYLRRLDSADTRVSLIYKELGVETLSKEQLGVRMKKLQQQLRFCESEKSQTEKECEKMENEIREMERSIQTEMLIQEPGRKEEVEASLVSTSKALIALEMLENATRGAIRKERQNKLESIYKEIADVWNKMKEGEDYRVEFDDKTVPVLFKRNQKFEMSQLSGGEKTAMLVIVRAVLCRRFTQTGFMLLDEPLEHLDSRNRRLLIDFLVESFEKGWLDQLIVTTFEESIIRKFHEHEKVNIIAI